MPTGQADQFLNMRTYFDGFGGQSAQAPRADAYVPCHPGHGFIDRLTLACWSPQRADAFMIAHRTL